MANSQMLSGNTTYLAGFWDDSYKTQLLGIVIAIAGNFLISISLNLQKYTHVRLSRQKDPEPYYKSVLWWCAIVLMGIGELGNFTAYGFAPATLVAPLGCVSVIASAVISVAFLKETLRASDLLGGALAISGTYLLVTFAPNISQNITAFKVQKYLVSWQFLVYLFFEIIVFCILLYLYKKKDLKHIVVVLMLVALLASLTVISVKAVAGMITESVKGHLQLTYPIFYVMLIIMVASCAFQVKFLNQAMEIFDATEVVPINFVFFTASAIIAVLSGCFYSSSKMASHVFLRTTFPIILLVTGVIFYQEFYGVALLNIFMFLFGILLSFLGVFLITRNRERKKSEVPFIDIDQVPGQKSMDKIQPDASSISYGSLDAEAKPLGNKDGELKDTASNLLSSHKP